MVTRVNELSQKILKDILSDPNLKIGDKLPYITELAQRYEVSKPTMGKALSILQMQGYVEGRRGNGIFVTALPNKAAYAQANSKYSIGFLACSMQRTVPNRIFQGISRRAGQLRANLQIANTDWEMSEESWHFHNMAKSGLDGVIVYPVLNRQPESDYLQTDLPDFPTVIIDTTIPNVGRPSVVFDNWSAGYEMTKFLLEKGHRHITFLRLHAPVPHRAIEDRLAGFQRAMEEAGISPSEYFISDYSNIGEEDENRQHVREFLRKAPSPTAIISPTDNYAHQLVSLLGDEGLIVPRDVVVVGFDNTQEVEWREPFLTTDPKMERMGERAVEMLIQLIEGKIQGVPELILPCPLYLPSRLSPDDLVPRSSMTRR